MASPSEPPHTNQQLGPTVTHLVHSTASNLLSIFASPKTTPSPSTPPPAIRVGLLLPNSPKPLAFQPDSNTSAMKGVASSPESTSGFPSTVRIAGLNSNIKGGGGPAFVGRRLWARSSVFATSPGLVSWPSPPTSTSPLFPKELLSG
ncbi:hypothetical protein TB1_002077 [Malus domestica]